MKYFLPLRRISLKNSRIVLICLPLSLALCLLIISTGSFDLYQPYQFSAVYYDMWQHLTKLSLEVDETLIGIEGFKVNGITTAYFLPFPAVIRGLQSIFNLGESPTLSVLIACFIYLYSAANYFVFLLSNIEIKTKMGSFLSRLTLALVILFPPILPTLTLPTIYAEAVIWGYSLFFSCIALSHIVLANSTSTKMQYNLILLAVFCGISLFIRAPYSLASLVLFYLTILMLVYKHDGYFWRNCFNSKFMLPVIIFTLFALGLGWFNYAKWGNPFEFYALKYYVSGNFTGSPFTEEEYQQLMQYGVLHPSRILHNLSYYFLPHMDNFIKEIPFFSIGGSNILFGVGNPINYKEPTYPIPLMLPVYFVFFVSGLIIFSQNLIKRKAFIFNGALIPGALAACIPPLVILCHHANALRYSGEFICIITLFSLYAIAFLFQKLDRSFEQINNGGQFKRARKFSVYFLLIMALSCISFFYGITGAFIHDNLLRKFEIYYPTSPVKLKHHYTFGRNASELNGNVFLGKGWSEPENDLIWSSGQTAFLRIPTPYYLRKATVQITAGALITPKHPKQTIDILINGDFYQSIDLNAWSENQIEIRDIDIHRHHRSWLEKITNTYTEPGFINIELRFKDAISPKQLGLGEDSRILAFAIKKLEVGSKRDYKNYPDDHIIKGDWITK